MVFTDLHDQTFGLRPDGTGQNLIFNEGPIDDGPRYFASLVVYGILHYLGTLGGGNYPGRDIVNDNSIVDRLGAVMGVGAAFAGTADEIPLKKRWENDFTFGFSIDMRYVADLFAR